MNMYLLRNEAGQRCMQDPHKHLRWSALVRYFRWLRGSWPHCCRIIKEMNFIATNINSKRKTNLFVIHKFSQKEFVSNFPITRLVAGELGAVSFHLSLYNDLLLV